MKILTNKNQSGFTLIEAIVVLVLMGILAVGLSLGLVKGVQSYLFTNEATQLSQNAQVALAIIKKELTDATAVTAASKISDSDDKIEYTRPYSLPSCQQPTGCQYRIQKSGNKIELVGLSPAFAAVTLIDNVGAYPSGSKLLSFINFSGTEWSHETGDTVNNLAQINVTLILAYGSNQTLTFNSSINPRQGSSLNQPRIN